MAMDGAGCVTAAIAAGVSPAVALFRSLGDETRLRIVARLAAREARVVDLTGELGLAQSTVFTSTWPAYAAAAWWITAPKGGTRSTR